MFKKLLSNLPFNPSLISEVGFYAKRLRKESSIRRAGAGFLVLALMVQVIAAAVPSEPTLARSGNDVIPGGFSTQGEAVNHCKANRYNFKKILDHFGVDCLALYYGKVQTISSRDYGSQLYSMGRAPYGKPGEVSVTIPGTGKFYMRPLWTWDSAGASSYKAITGKRKDGTPFMILFSCGNITIVGRPTPPPPPPPPPPPKGIKCANLIMSVRNKSEVTVGTLISVRGQAVGKNLPRGQQISMRYQFVDTKTGRVIGEKRALGLGFRGNIAQDTTARPFRVDKEGRYAFRLSVRYDGGKEAPGSRVGSCTKVVIVKKEVPCEDYDDDDEVTVCLILTKKAANVTQDEDDANGTQAKAGDTVVYTLAAKNTSTNTPVEDYVIEENITDVLEYADVVDYHGGEKDEHDIVRWPAVDIAPGQTVEQKLTIKIKDPIPNTPKSSSNPGSYDCTITNVYGDSVNIELPCSIPKTTEQITGSIPNTGPGETLAVAFAVTAVAGYFLSRSRLMARELEVARDEYVTHGGN